MAHTYASSHAFKARDGRVLGGVGFNVERLELAVIGLLNDECRRWCCRCPPDHIDETNVGN
jgi:hypothetical protein